jgi:hypothetical protein
VAVLVALPASGPVAERLDVGRFSSRDLAGWEETRFEGETRYRLLRLGPATVLGALSEGSASGLVRRMRVDLQRYPYLNWRWRVDEQPERGDERTRSGDDYAARIYVIASGGLAFWNTKAVNYVWAAQAGKGETWPNAFAGDNAMMLALRSGEARTSTWYSEKRNVLEDFNTLHGDGIRFIDAVALMTDTDNGDGRAEAYYGDIFFSSH